DYLFVFEHRNHEIGPCPSKIAKGDRCRVTLLLVNRLLRVIGDVDDVFRGNRASETCLAARFKYRLAFSKLSKSWRHIAHCDDAKAPIAFVQQQQSEGGVAKSGRIRQHCLKYRSEVARRTRYDTQDLRRGRLLLQRFGEVRGALTQFVEESRILDGN